MSTTILTADDDQRFLAIVRRCLEEEPDLSLVGQATDGEQAVRLAGDLQPDVVLMDLSMPRMNGLEATRQIKARQPDTKVVIVTMHDEEPYQKAAAENGADSFLCKKTLLKSLIPTIRQVLAKGLKTKAM
ncbi:MAG: response regulator transcription factor [Deltaproteobacteria bacterium]|nr:response regulator transcription factor [Deltaproteobacteria bacterium]